MLKVFDYKQYNTPAPFEIVEANIEKILINRKKLYFLKNFDKEILDDAIQTKKLEIFPNFFIIFVLFLSIQSLYSQENLRFKLDGVASVVGDFVILDSDIDKTFSEMESQGISTKNVTRCELLGKLMEDKLYAHHAIQDSLEVSDTEIYSYVDQSIEYFTEQLGSLEKVLEFYNKKDELSFRDELYELNKIQKLSQLMQSKIVDDVEVTPEEVKLFYESIPVVDLPIFGTELEISQIVIEPNVSEEEKNRVINMLNSFKNDVEEKGLSFASKAILYSQDPGSRANGGKYTLHRKRPRMVKEFRDVAFSLEEGEISSPFKTEFGWHILTVEKIRGQQVDVRHILITPNIDESKLTESKKLLDTIRKRILDKEMNLKMQHLIFL